MPRCPRRNLSRLVSLGMEAKRLPGYNLDRRSLRWINFCTLLIFPRALSARERLGRVSGKARRSIRNFKCSKAKIRLRGGRSAKQDSNRSFRRRASDRTCEVNHGNGTRRPGWWFRECPLGTGAWDYAGAESVRSADTGLRGSSAEPGAGVFSESWQRYGRFAQLPGDVSELPRRCFTTG